MNFVEGEILYFDKPYGWSSFDVVNRVRGAICRQLKQKKLKVGHAGTLDPLATGVMIVCTGKATKHIEELQYGIKEYVATLKLGATTPSFDREHPEDATYPTDHITKESLEEALKCFLGEIWQVPPVYSAVKVDGKRAFDYARKGKDVELKAKLLVIDEIELVSFDREQMQAVIRVVCSKGTYIRALARDIGIKLNSGAYLTDLRRTRVGDITVEQCMNPTDLTSLFNDNNNLNEQ